MSIANEIERIMNAKADIKRELELRGVAVDEDKTIDDYGYALSSCPYAIRGFFTPEEDTNSFSISDLPFVPHSFEFGCDGLTSSAVSMALINGHAIKGNNGVVCMYNNNNVKSSLNITPTSSAVSWSDSAFSIEIPASRGYVFKAGYTYEYLMTGGFGE